MDLQNKLDEMQAETLKEYMLSYAEQKDKIERFDEKIEEIARMDRYSKLVSKLVCFLGVKTHTALSLIVETGDFMRFAKGNIFAAFLGLAQESIQWIWRTQAWDYQSGQYTSANIADRSCKRDLQRCCRP